MPYDSDDRETDEQCRRAASRQRTARAHKEASADGATNGDHVKVPRFHRFVQLVVLVGERSLTERLRCQAKPREQTRPSASRGGEDFAILGGRAFLRRCRQVGVLEVHGVHKGDTEPS